MRPELSLLCCALRWHQHGSTGGTGKGHAPFIAGLVGVFFPNVARNERIPCREGVSEVERIQWGMTDKVFKKNMYSAMPGYT